MADTSDLLKSLLSSSAAKELGKATDTDSNQVQSLLTSALPLLLTCGAGGIANSTLGSAACTARGTALAPASPDEPAGSGLTDGSGEGGGAVIVTVKVDTTVSTAFVARSGAKARISPISTTTCSRATAAAMPRRTRGDAERSNSSWSMPPYATRGPSRRSG